MNAFEWPLLVLYLQVEILQLVHEISSFLVKHFSKFTDKLKELSSRGVLSKDVQKNFEKFTEKHICRNLF